VNIASQELSGFDLKTEYTWNTDTWGRFNASVSAGYYESFAVTFLPGDAPFETAGRATITNGTIPRWTSYTFVGWQRGPYAASVGFQYVPSVKDEGWYDATDSGADEHVESFSSFDLSGSYTFGNGSRYLKGLTLTIGVNNVFNEPPSIAKGTFADSNTDSATYGDVGRFMYVEAKYKF
jgi:iron complex outermembrane receptor protein